MSGFALNPSSALAEANGSASAHWRAEIELGFDRRGSRSFLAHRRSRGPLVVQKPLYPEGEAVCHVILIHPPGGIVGGDQLHIDVNVSPNTQTLITTPGSGKYYRSLGDLAVQKQRFSVAENGVLEWLPQDNILFSGCRASLSTQVDLVPGARFIFMDMSCLGRPASNDSFDDAQVTQSLNIRRVGEPLLSERAVYQSGHAMLQQPWGLAGHTVIGTLIATEACREYAAPVRQYLENTASDVRCAVTVINDVLIFRCLSHNAEKCRQHLINVWAIVRPLITGRVACPPRIWRT